jgi:hypothetical protein
VPLVDLHWAIAPLYEGFPVIQIPPPNGTRHGYDKGNANDAGEWGRTVTSEVLEAEWARLSRPEVRQLHVVATVVGLQLTVESGGDHRPAYTDERFLTLPTDRPGALPLRGTARAEFTRRRTRSPTRSICPRLIGLTGSRSSWRCKFSASLESPCKFDARGSDTKAPQLRALGAADVMLSDVAPNFSDNQEVVSWSGV